MSDTADLYRAMREHNRQANSRRDRAIRRTLQDGFALATAHGLWLREVSDGHFQLSDEDNEWLINLYPSTGRIYHDPRNPPPKYQEPEKWNFLSIVQALIEAQRGA